MFLTDTVTLSGIVSDLRLLQFGGINASTLYTDDKMRLMTVCAYSHIY